MLSEMLHCHQSTERSCHLVHPAPTLPSTSTCKILNKSISFPSLGNVKPCNKHAWQIAAYFIEMAHTSLKTLIIEE